MYLCNHGFLPRSQIVNDLLQSPDIVIRVFLSQLDLFYPVKNPLAFFREPYLVIHQMSLNKMLDLSSKLIGLKLILPSLSVLLRLSFLPIGDLLFRFERGQVMVRDVFALFLEGRCGGLGLELLA
jgi:hypothetical protein